MREHVGTENDRVRQRALPARAWRVLRRRARRSDRESRRTRLIKGADFNASAGRRAWCARIARRRGATESWRAWLRLGHQGCRFQTSGGRRASCARVARRRGRNHARCVRGDARHAAHGVQLESFEQVRDRWSAGVDSSPRLPISTAALVCSNQPTVTQDWCGAARCPVECRGWDGGVRRRAATVHWFTSRSVSRVLAAS